MISAREDRPEQMTDEGRGYAGSRFSDVAAAVFANPYQRVWGGEGEPPLPVGEVWREDRNDPNTAPRVGGRKVR